MRLQKQTKQDMSLYRKLKVSYTSERGRENGSFPVAENRLLPIGKSRQKPRGFGEHNARVKRVLMFCDRQDKNFIILGFSGSGKNTQATLLAKKFNLRVIDGGDYLRELSATKTTLGEKVGEKINQGNLAPTSVVRDWLRREIFSKPKQGLIISGQPRMLGEAKLTLKWFKESGRGLPTVIFLKVSQKTAIERLKKRFICQKCGKVCFFNKKAFWVCSFCKGKITKRLDDTPRYIKNRLSYFKKVVTRTLDYFKKNNILVKVNGDQSIPKVHQDILRYLSRESKK